MTPTREDVLRQIRHLKTIAPELPGVGFFTAKAAPGVAEYADELCAVYYLNPVLTLVPGSLQARVRGKALELSATLRNDGGMTARQVTVQFGPGYGSGFRPTTRQVVAALAPQSAVTVAALLVPQAGVHAYSVRVVAPPGLAVLNETVWTVLAKGLPEQAWVVYQPPTETPGEGVPLFADAPANAPSSSARPLGSDGRGGAVPAAVLPGLPGDAAGVVTWVPASLPPDQPSAFELTRTRAAAAPSPAMQRDGERLTVSANGYVAVLDLAKDQIDRSRGLALPREPLLYQLEAFQRRRQAVRRQP